MSMSLSQPDCAAISYAPWCSVLVTEGWCQWDYSSNRCLPTFEDGIFVPSFDPIISKSIIFVVYVGVLYLLFKLCGFLIRASNKFDHLNADELLKCKVYLFEVITTSFCFAWFASSGFLNFIFTNSIEKTPDHISKLLRAASATHLILIVYMIEMAEMPKMRTSLKIHHLCSMLGIFLLWLAMGDTIDLRCARIGAIMMLYPFMEQTVFIQLLLYKMHKVSKTKTEHTDTSSDRAVGLWAFHYLLTLWFALTRIMIFVLVVGAYIDMSKAMDFKEAEPLYLVYYIFVPIINITLLLAQSFTVSALFHMTKSCISATSSTTPKYLHTIKLALWIISAGFVALFYLLATNTMWKYSDSCSNIHSASNTIFGEELCGTLVSEFDGEIYDQSRFQYASLSYPQSVHPSFVLYAKCDEDISRAIAYAEQCDYKVSIRSGGHQYSALSSCNSAEHQCMQIDMSNYKAFEVTDTDTVKIGVGNTLTELLAKLNDARFFIPAGICPYVGVGGHFQTGGYGAFINQYGLAIDHIVAFDIILADHQKYRVIKPSTTNNSAGTNSSMYVLDDELNDDVYWAVLGGNPGSFGVVTEFEVQPIFDRDHIRSEAGLVVWKYNKEVLKSVLAAVAELEEVMMAITERGEYQYIVYTAPQLIDDIDVVMFGYTYGDLGVAPFNQSYIQYVVDKGNEIEQYLEFQTLHAPLSRLAMFTVVGEKHGSVLPYVRSVKWSLQKLDSDFLDTFVEQAYVISQHTGILHETAISFHYNEKNALSQHGKANLTSFAHRDSRAFIASVYFYDERTANRSYVESATDDLWNATNYDDLRAVSFTSGDVNISNVWQYYYDSAEQYNRLRTVKTNVDPDDVFSTCFTVKPIVSDISGTLGGSHGADAHKAEYFGSEGDVTLFVSIAVSTLILCGLICIARQACIAQASTARTEEKVQSEETKQEVDVEVQPQSQTTNKEEEIEMEQTSPSSFSPGISNFTQ